MNFPIRIIPTIILDTRYHTKTFLASNEALKGASLIGIQDVGSLFTGTTVEAALQEIGVSVDSIETNISNIEADIVIIEASLLVTKTTLVTKTADYTATDSDSVIVIDATSNTVTITLPTAVSISGREYSLKCIDDTYTVTIDGNGTETIDGELTQTLNIWDCIKVVSDGTNWLII